MLGGLGLVAVAVFGAGSYDAASGFRLVVVVEVRGCLSPPPAAMVVAVAVAVAVAVFAPPVEAPTPPPPPAAPAAADEEEGAPTELGLAAAGAATGAAPGLTHTFFVRPPPPCRPPPLLKPRPPLPAPYILFYSFVVTSAGEAVSLLFFVSAERDNHAVPPPLGCSARGVVVVVRVWVTVIR